jgi:hypothetical protein
MISDVLQVLTFEIANFGLSTNIVYKSSGVSGVRYHQPLMKGAVPNQTTKLSKL